MPSRLRAILVSIPFIAVVALIALYAGLGFFAVPALVKWQGEKQVGEKLGQRLAMGEVRFNPFTLSLEVDDLALADPQGNPLLAFKRLHVDLSSASAIERAWILDELTLDAPLVHFERDKAGRQNFAQLMERIGSDPDSPLPRLVVKRLALRDGRVEFLDRLLDAPLVTRVAPMLIEIENLSTLPGQSASTRLTGRTEADEQIELTGTLAINPLSLKGRVALRGVKLATLVRAVSRELSLEAPAGTIDLAADLDLAVDAQGSPGGGAKNIDLTLSAFSLRAPGAGAPLLAAETLALRDGQLDLAKHEIVFGRFNLANGSAAAAIDARGRGDWTGFLGEAPATAAGTARPAPDARAKPWKVSIAKAEVARIALRFEDAAAGQRAQVAALGLTVSPSIELGAQGMRATLGPLGVTLAGVDAQRGSDRIALQSAGFDAASMSVATDDATGSIDAGLDAPALRILALSLRRPGGAKAFVELGEVRAAARSLAFRRAGAGAPPALRGEGLTASLADALLRDPVRPAELLRLGSAKLSGGALRLQARTLGFDKAVLAKGRLAVSRDAKGAFNWESLFAAGPSQAGAPVAKAPAGTKATPAGWRFTLAQGKFEDFAIDVEDRQRTPALALGLDAIGISVTGFDSGAAKPFGVALKANVRSGGRIEASGQARADRPMADLDLKLSQIALSPLRSLVSDVAALRLAAGSASAAGHLRYGVAVKDAPALLYKGSVSIDGVDLREAASGRAFLGWGSIASSDVLATLQPNRVDIGELRVDKLAARVVIAADRTVNLLEVMKSPGARPAATASAAPAAAGREDAPQDDPFPVSITRVRVAEGTLAFADLSLRPQFGAQMHELQGVITGLATGRAGSAQVQLDARVDKYGSAGIRGRISVPEPRRSTDMALEFRNLEMNALSPYVEKFAGYRIAAGRLALDLEYKLRDGKLNGRNKVVLNKVELGPKVDSPGALDLPLDLAIAILKDSNGVIDVDLPISGDLDDPKFDYGGVIAKAVGNLIGGILTAPFRALGALFGGGEAPIDAIDFAPGSDAIAPPERQKLAALARALKDRPQLLLKVPPTYAQAADAAALRSRAARADILRRMDIPLRAGEDPGPLDAGNPRVQAAVEAAFSERYSPAVFAQLKSRVSPPAAAKEAATPGADPVRVFYRGLIDRLVKDTPVAESALAALGTRRSEALIRELTTVEGIPAARVVPGAATKAEGTGTRTVALKLELGVAK